jgi:peptide/nickel transport system substrate-binding protein
LVRDALQEMKDEGFIPEGVVTVAGKSYVTPQEAQARYDAALAWFEQYGHLVISQGPYILTTYDPEAQFAELRAFRDTTYPFKPGDWYFGLPKSVEVREIDVEAVDLVKVEETLPIGVETRLVIALQGPGNLSARYALRDSATGKVIIAGPAEIADGRALVTLPAEVTAQLTPGGLYEILIAANSDESAAVTEQRIALVAEPFSPPKPEPQIIEKTVEVPVEKVVEKRVEVPVVPVWMWALVGALALLVVILGLTVVLRRRPA